MKLGRHLFSLAAALALVAVACGDAGSSDEGAEAPATTGSTAEPGAGGVAVVPGTPQALPEGPSALRTTSQDPDFPPSLVDPAEIISGGPPPDGIPPIDDPVFVGIDVADGWLEDSEPIVVLDIDGDARAYPVQIMIWHEIVNDTVGGVPVSVTYCPLCNSAATYIRVVRGNETSFGTSGRLFASALVMYDRATESLWTHFDGVAVVGVLTGDELESIPSPLLSWADFMAAYPDGQVLDRDSTGFARRYGANPYVGYDDEETQPFLFVGDVDGRAAAKQRIVGVTIGDDAKAYSLDAVSDGAAKASHDLVGGQEIVIFWKSGQATALEDGSVAGGRDVGSVGVFVPVADGRSLTFSADGDAFTDAETGSSWNVTGQATTGPLAGSQLERLDHLDTFWFAWATYQPGTELIESL